MVRGDLDVGSTTPQAIANAHHSRHPDPVIATGAVYTGDPRPVQLVVANSTLSEARQFAEATIAVQTLNDSQTLGVFAWLQQNRIETTKVKFIEIRSRRFPLRSRAAR